MTIAFDKVRKNLGYAVAAVLFLISTSNAGAQDAPQSPPVQQATTTEAPAQTGSVADIIAANKAGGAAALTKALAPLLTESPSLASEVIAEATKDPELSEVLAQVLANIQTSLKAIDPEKAKTLATILASAPPAFQAAYAVALSPGDGGSTGGNAGGTGSTGASSGDGGGTGAAGVGFGGGSGGAGGAAGGGGGTISPSAP